MSDAQHGSMIEGLTGEMARMESLLHIHSNLIQFSTSLVINTGLLHNSSYMTGLVSWFAHAMKSHYCTQLIWKAVTITEDKQMMNPDILSALNFTAEAVDEFPQQPIRNVSDV